MKRAFWFGLLAGPALVATTLAQGPTTTPPAAPRNIWSFFSKTPEQKAQCKDAFCNSPLGKMTSSAAAPLTAMTGGLTQNRCANKALDDILKNKDKEGSAEGAAAAIKKEEAGAKARREAVRFLGTVDCTRFPEAQEVLIKSLLFDTNECVRFEAAVALQSGCCCNKDIIKALTDCISGKSKFVEGSERVKAAAAEALNRCTVVATLPTEIKKKNGDVIKKTELSPEEYFKRIREISQADVLDEAQQALADFRANQPAAAEDTAQRPGPRRPTSVAEILSGAFSPSARNSGAAPVETAAQPSADPAAEPKVLNAVLTSQAKPAVASQAPAAPIATERRPYFDNLTRALKGKQVGRTTVIPVEPSGSSSATPTATTPESDVQPGVAAPASNPETAPPLTPGAGAAPSTPLTVPPLPPVPESPPLP